MTAKRRIIIDCDPGVDDALALFLAMGAADVLTMAGVTTVAGNVSVEAATINARRILGYGGRPDMPVHAGCGRPLMQPVGRRSKVHGEDGLGSVDLSGHEAPLAATHAVDFLIDAVMADPGEITLCVLGPMTNIALAIVKEPRLAKAVREIVFMGGAAFRPGNVSPVAEFNIFVDPQAAHIVLTSGAPLTMVGLDVTAEARVDRAYIDTLAGRPGRVSCSAAALLDAYGRGDPSLHDPCVIAYLLEPTIFTAVQGLIEVDCSEGPSRGQTIVSISEKHLGCRSTNGSVLTELKKQRLFSLLTERLDRLP
jgi:purine nucleosidase